MENVILIVHLVLALCLIGAVLLQRSEGGGLMGGGGAMTGRAAASAMTKLTWGFAVAFIVTSITLTILAAKNSADSSVLDRLGNAPAPEAQDNDAPTLPGGGDLLPPPSTTGGSAPALPPRAE